MDEIEIKKADFEYYFPKREELKLTTKEKTKLKKNINKVIHQ